MQVDSNGDGTFEETTYLLSEQVTGVGVFWPYVAAGMILVLAAAFVSWRHVAKGKRAKPPPNSGEPIDQ